MGDFIANYRNTLKSLKEIVWYFTENHTALDRLPAWVWDKEHGIDFEKFGPIIESATQDLIEIKSRTINLQEHNLLATNPARRLMVMIAKLHELGYEKIRFYPHIGGAGFWRYEISTSSLRPSHRYLEKSSGIIAVHGSLGTDTCTFGWDDTPDDSIERLAYAFLTKYPEFAIAGKGSDIEYAEWYRTMLKKTRPGGIIYLWWDGAYEENDSVGIMNCGKKKIKIPFPPGYRISADQNSHR